jgi:hypothetical protein
MWWCGARGVTVAVYLLIFLGMIPWAIAVDIALRHDAADRHEDADDPAPFVPMFATLMGVGLPPQQQGEVVAAPEVAVLAEPNPEIQWHDEMLVLDGFVPGEDRLEVEIRGRDLDPAIRAVDQGLDPVIAVVAGGRATDVMVGGRLVARIAGNPGITARDVVLKISQDV